MGPGLKIKESGTKAFMNRKSKLLSRLIGFYNIIPKSGMAEMC